MIALLRGGPADGQRLELSWLDVQMIEVPEREGQATGKMFSYYRTDVRVGNAVVFLYPEHLH